MEIPVLYADSALVVCLKPAGVLSEEAGLPTLLRAQLGGECYCVHRLDRAVGGVMVYARTKQAASALSAAIAAGELEKRYLAVLQGAPEKESGSFEDWLYHDAQRNKSYVVKRPRRGVKKAVLSYELLARAQAESAALSLVRITLQTGRSHQIRVQFASRGLPLLCDSRYGSSLRGGEIALFSESLRFKHPLTGDMLFFSAEKPKGFPWELFG